MRMTLTKKQLLKVLVLFLTLSNVVHAQTYYFKCTAAVSPGIYQWSNTANWYTDAACTIAAGAIPVSSNDVVFSANSFTANNQSVSFNQTTMACKHFSVANSSFTGCNFAGVPNTKLSVFGDFNMSALTQTVNLSIGNWGSTTIEFNPVNIGVQSITTGTANVFSNNIEIPGNIVSRTVNFMDTLQIKGIFSIGTTYSVSASVNVNFNQLVKLIGNGYPQIICVSGISNFNNGIFYTSAFPNSVPALIPAYNRTGAGGIYLQNSSMVTLLPNTQRGRNELYSLAVEGDAGSFAQLTVTNQTLIATGGLALRNGNINFTNSTIDCYNFFSAGNYNSGGFMVANCAPFTTTGSVININTPSNSTLPSRFAPNAHTFNIVNIKGNTSISSGNGDFQMWNSPPATFKQLNILNKATLLGTNYVKYDIAPGGLFSMAPGTSITGTAFITTASTAGVGMAGNCTGGVITLSDIIFNFGTMPPSNLSVDYLVLSNTSASGSFTNYDPGMHSLNIYGTNCSGWIPKCKPAGRTLFWQGPVLNGKWSDPANWSANPLASPSATQNPITMTGGYCYPTFEDSIVIPTGSVIDIDPFIAYTKSMNYVGSATITTTNPNQNRLEVWGTYWGNKYVKNAFNNMVDFKTYESYPVIKTGGVPFSTVQFDGQDVPDALCIPDATKPRGKWVLLDTFAVVSPMELAINSGRLHTYSSNPLFASYFPAAQHKGSTIVVSTHYFGMRLTFVSNRDTANFYDSDVYLFNAEYGPFNLYCKNEQLIEGTSNFIFAGVGTYGGASLRGRTISGNRLHEVTVKSHTLSLNVSANQLQVAQLPQNLLSNTSSQFIYTTDNDSIDVLSNYQQLTFSPMVGAGINNNTYVRKITSFNSNGTGFLNFTNNGINYSGTVTNLPFTVDTISSFGDMSVQQNTNASLMKLNVRKLLSLEQGNITLSMGNTMPSAITNNVTINLFSGSTFISKGTCGAKNYIKPYSPLGTSSVYSSFNLSGAISQTITNTDIQDVVVSGGTLNTTGVTTGSTTGWIPAAAPAPRLLHWTDGITAGGVAKDWSSIDRWRQAVSGSTSSTGIPNLAWGTTPQCPPTCADTVYIDNSSFTATLTVGDDVKIDGTNYQASVGKLYWNTTSAMSYTPSMTGVSSSQLSVCDSLYFCNQMTNTYPGVIILKGNNLPGLSYHGIKSANKVFPGRLILDCTKAELTEYRLRDSLTGTYAANIVNEVHQASLNHWAGNLNTNGFTLNLFSYSSVSNSNRKLTIAGSKVRINGYHFRRDEAGYSPYFGPTGWLVINNGSTKTYSLQATNSRIILNTDPVNLTAYGNATGNGIIGGGYKYNDIEFYGNSSYFYNTGGQLGGTYKPNHFPAATIPLTARIDTFNHVINNIVATTLSSARLYLGGGSALDGIVNYPCVPKIIVHSVICNNSPLNITNTTVDVDSMEFYYRHPTLATYNIYSSNRYFKHWGLYGISAPQQVNMAKDSVQWLQNTCDFRPSGNNANKVNFFSLTPGSKTYIRKDSGRVCADWLVLKDIWAVGSGSTKGPVTTPLCMEPPATDFKCDWDTLSTFDGGGYGPFTAISPTDPNYTTSKRAWFQAGNGTDFQANNQGWEKKDTEPEPKLALSQNSTICEGDTAIITFQIQGVFPFNVYFNENTSSPSFPASANTANNINFTLPTSYTQSPSVATYSASNNPVGYMYFLVPQNGTALNAGTAANPYVLSVKLTPTVTTQYSLGYLVTGKCVNNVSTPANSTGNALVNVNPAPVNMLASVTPSVICTGTPVTYTANAIYGSAYFLYAAPTGTAITGTLINTTTGTVTTGSLTVTTYSNNGTSPLIYNAYMGAVSPSGCSSLSRTPLTVTVNPLPTIASFTQTNVVCFGGASGSAHMTANGGTPAYTYSWSPGVASVASTATGLSAGNYTGTVIDANNCVVKQAFVITELALLTSTITNISQASCGMANASASVSAAGGTGPYVYGWATPTATYSTTSAVTYSLAAGVNNLTLTDANGCIAQTAVTITNPNAPVITTTVTNVLCFNGTTGSIVSSVSGASAYTYTWSNGAHTASLINAVAGIYTLAVSDNSNCLSVVTATITQPLSPVLVSFTNVTGINCFGQSTGAASTSVTGGTPGYVYQWMPGNFTSPALTNAAAGNYTLTVTDINGCVLNTTVSIAGAGSGLEVVLTNSIKPVCGKTDGQLTVSVSGGSPAYTYTWNTGEHRPTLSNIDEGTYTVMVSDSYGCTDSLNVMVECKIDLFIPQLFSPNGDGKNDKFEILAIKNYPDNTFTVFNRWGSMVYKKQKYANEWDGKANVNDALGNGLLPLGTYFVVLEFNDGVTPNYAGYVELTY